MGGKNNEFFSESGQPTPVGERPTPWNLLICVITHFQKYTPITDLCPQLKQLHALVTRKLGFVLHFPPKASMYLKNKKVNMVISSLKNHLVLLLHVDKFAVESTLPADWGGEKTVLWKLAEVS